MEDHDSTHTNRMITSGQWKHFFKDLDQSHRGKHLRLLRGEDLLSGSPSGELSTLKSLEYKGSGNNHRVIVATELAGDMHESTVEFNLVWGIFDRDDRVVSIQFVDDYNRKVILEFDQ